MPNTNPYEPGDDIYQQYDLTRTMRAASGVAITKGNLYTLNADGRLIALTASSGAIASTTKGLFQAKTSVDAVTYTDADNAPEVQCLINGEFIVMKAPANIVEGDRVAVGVGTGTTITPDKVEVATSSSYLDYLGTVFQILTVDTDENKKLKTAVDDLIVIQRGLK